MPTILTVVLIEAHEQVRRALAARLGHDPRLHVAAALADLPSLTELQRLQPAIILFGISGRPERAEAAEAALRRGLTRCAPVIILSSVTIEQERDSMLAAGASAYLQKTIDTPELIEQIQRHALRKNEVGATNDAPLSLHRE